MDDSPEQVKAGKVAEFEAVVSQYEGALLRYVSRILRDADMAQDVVQDTFIKLSLQWKQELMPGPGLSSWLYRVAHNAAVDQLRKRERRKLFFLKQAEDTEPVTPPNRGAGLETSAAAERAGQALGCLNVKEQQLVILKVYEEKSYKEISDITGLSTTNVGYILHYAMKKMADALKTTAST